jgi:23S rRNA (uracil1939-C5)-methyltransferase
MQYSEFVGTKFYGLVRGMSNEGMGVIDHPSSKVFFSLGVFPGDEGEFEIIRIKEKYGFAKLLELHKASFLRIEVPCPHYGLRPGQCGGCPWMPLPYETQVQFKSETLKGLLLRHQYIPETYKVPFISSPRHFGFRNRAQFKTNGKQVGFVSRFSRSIAPINNCLVLNAKMQKMLKHIHSLLPQESWTPSLNYPWCFLEVDDKQDLHEIQINKRRPFRQANTEQNQNMKSWLEKKIQHWTKDSVILELFSGSGNFTEILVAQNFTSITCAEIACDGNIDLRTKFGSKVQLVETNLFKPSEWKRIKEKIPACDYLILDPPRDGFPNLDMFANQFRLPKEIIYISCDLNSFINEAGRLRKRGYTLSEVVGVDQFPHTPHIEILSVFNLFESK